MKKTHAKWNITRYTTYNAAWDDAWSNVWRILYRTVMNNNQIVLNTGWAAIWAAYTETGQESIYMLELYKWSKS